MIKGPKTRLENRYGVTPIVGSNPTPSASRLSAVPAKIPPRCVDPAPCRSSSPRWSDPRGATEGADMAQYLVLIYEDEANWAAGGPAAEAVSKGHTEFGQKHAD